MELLGNSLFNHGLQKPKMEDSRWLGFDEVERFLTDVLVRIGVSKEDASVCADVLVTAHKRGIDTHGINKMKHLYYDKIKAGTVDPKAEFEIVRDGPTTAVVDGHDGLGHPIGKKAMNIAIRKAKKYGMGMTVVRNSNHFGIAGYYSIMAAKEGLIGICGTNTRPAVAPTFGTENMLGTNPMAFAMPTDEDFPFVFDGATSVAHWGKVEMCRREGKLLPEGTAIGEDGKERRDPVKLLEDFASGKAALTTLGGITEETGGHKGYGFSTVVEILSAALQQGSFLKALSGMKDGKKTPCRIGHFFMAIDVSSFTDIDDFRKTTGDILRALRNSRKAPGKERIYTAGEKEHIAWLERKEKGIPVSGSLMKDMARMKEETGIDGYAFLEG